MFEFFAQRSMIRQAKENEKLQRRLALEQRIRDLEMQAALADKDGWVAGENMHPMTNIHDRIWRLKDGSRHGIYGVCCIDFPTTNKDIEWYFTPRQRGEAG